MTRILPFTGFWPAEEHHQDYPEESDDYHRYREGWRAGPAASGIVGSRGRRKTRCPLGTYGAHGSSGAPDGDVTDIFVSTVKMCLLMNTRTC